MRFLLGFSAQKKQSAASLRSLTDMRGVLPPTTLLLRIVMGTFLLPRHTHASCLARRPMYVSTSKASDSRMLTELVAVHERLSFSVRLHDDQCGK